jgi:hypothetical protein
MADTPDEPDDDGAPRQPEDEKPEEPAAPADAGPPHEPLPRGLRIDPSLLRGLRDAVNAVDPRTLSRFRRGVAAVAAMPPEFWQRKVPAMPPPFDMDKIRKQFAGVVLPKIDLTGLAAALDRAKEALPPNWDGLDHYEALGEIAKDDGIPVVWVPRASVLADLVAAPDRDERVKILLARQDEITEDCRSVMAEVTDPDLAPRVPQALEAVGALLAGFPQPAQALAVAVSESLLTEHIANGRSYKALATDVAVDTDELTIVEVRSTFALLPVHRFYTPWWPHSGVPAPGELSRHVTVHHARADHLTPENALIAIMLLSSVLRDLQAIRNP